MLKSFRYILYPFSVIYSGAIWLRNKMFDKNILRSSSFNFPIICVGNLALGGTGKTPMVEYLLRILTNEYEVATLSRGYKRKTKGFAIANKQTTALDIGDEPMQIHLKFPDVTVAVAEERIVGIPQLLHDRPQTNVIILDDAFQHREVRAGLNILLTDYNNLYTRDVLLPAGDLRDIKSSSHRADIIVVTKCKSHLDEIEKEAIKKEINPLSHQTVYFTKIEYSIPYHLFTRKEMMLDMESHVLLVCGIANPAPLKQMLTDFVATYEILNYRDHHIFNTDDLKEIKAHFEEMTGEKKLILTTEKDAVRLVKFEKELGDFPIYVFPMAHKFLFEEQEKYDAQITDFVRKFSIE